MTSRVFVAAVLFIVGSHAAAKEKTDVVEFKGGNRLVGELKHLDRGKLYFKTDATETISIDWAEVTALITKQDLRVILRNGFRHYGALVAAASPGMLAVSSAGEIIEVPLLDTTNVDPMEHTIWDRLDIDVSTGYSFTKATEVTQFNFDSEIRYETADRLRELDLSTQSTSSTEAKQSVRNTATYETMKLHDDLWVTGWIAGFEQNDALALDYRLSSAFGGGRRFFTHPNRRIRLFGGLQLNEEKFDGGDSEASLESVFVGTFDWFQFGEPELDLSTTLSVFPSLSDFGRVRAQLDISLKWEIFKDFYWALSVFDDYDSDPQSQNADSSTTNDYGVMTSIGWSH